RSTSGSPKRASRPGSCATHSSTSGGSRCAQPRYTLAPPPAYGMQTSRTCARGFGAGRRSQRSAIHLLPQAQPPHVGPDLLDVGEAVGLGARLALRAPAQRQLAVRRPDGVLLLVIDDHSVDGRVLARLAHGFLAFVSGCAGASTSRWRAAAATGPR